MSITWPSALPWRLTRSEPSANHAFHSWGNFHISVGQCSLSPNARVSGVAYLAQRAPSFVPARLWTYGHTRGRTLIQSTTSLGLATETSVFYCTRSTVSTTLRRVLSNTGITSSTESSSELYTAVTCPSTCVWSWQRSSLWSLNTCCSLVTFPILKTSVLWYNFVNVLSRKLRKEDCWNLCYICQLNCSYCGEKES